MRQRLARIGSALLLASAFLVAPGGDALAGSRLRPPPDVSLHPDRGMTFTRFSKTSHDQKVFKALNQGTRLPLIDPAIDPYNLNLKASVYDPQTGQIRGSLTDSYRAIRRAQDASRRAGREARSAAAARRPSGESTAAD